MKLSIKKVKIKKPKDMAIGILIKYWRIGKKKSRRNK